MNDSHSPIRLLHKMRAQAVSSAPARPALRRASRLMSLEQRFMFDAAAVATAAEAAHAHPDAHTLALLHDVAAPAQVKEADPSHNNGRKEVVFIDTSISGYKTLEAGVPEGFAVVEIDGSKDGLAQMAKWAETHAGYDAIHILSHAAEGKLELGTTLLDDRSLSNAQVQAEWAAVGHALNAGGDLMIYGCDLAKGTDGDLFIHDLAKATGADVAASTDLTGAADKGADWALEKQVGQIGARTLSLADYNDTLGDVTAGNDPGAAYSNTNSDARADVAQSFTATKTGVLTSITVYGSTTSDSTLNIYSGDGTGGTLLTTQTVAAFNAAGDADTGTQRYIGSTITLSSTVNITSGSQYTFQLTNADGVSITYTTNSDYSGGTAYDTGSEIGSNIDFEFSVLQGDPPNSAPSNSVSPAISGTQTVGNALSTTTGTWNDPDSDLLTYSYQWYRADDNSGTNATAIGSATSSSYTLTTSDAHEYVRAVVTADDGNSHTPTANSAWTAVNDSAPSNSVAPALSGTAIVGNALSATTGTWSDADGDTVTYTYQWYRADDNSGTNAAAIGAATASSYTLTSSDGNEYVRVVVTANDSHGSSNQTAASSWTSVATVPSVSSIVRTGGASATVGTSATSVQYTATFSESVTGVDATDFALTMTGTSSGNIASVSGSGTTYTVTVDTLDGDGILRLDLNSSGTGIKNGSNVDIASGYTSGSTYTLDHTAPNAPFTPDMTSGTDTGSSNSDNITSDATPTFTGTAESGSTVKLYDTDGTTVLGTATATGGNWSITSSALSDGSHTVTAKATDAAGNTSSASSGLSVAIDTAVPTGLGLSATTIATSNAASTSTIATLSATDSQSIAYSLAAGNGTNDADNGSFTISGNSLKVGGASLTAGTYKIYVAATDTAGNVANQAFTLTIVDAPGVSSIVRTGGASATVDTSATSVQYTVTFDQSVTGVDASDFAMTATGTASGSIASISGSGTTYTVTVDTLSGDGTLRLDLNGSSTGIQNGSNIDIAGGYTSGSSYTLDHTAPAAPSTPDMTSGTDSGSSNSDNITSNTTPTFTGTAESGSTITLYDTDGTTVLGTATATGGNWSITSSALSAGDHTVTAKATDAASNVSSASSDLSLTIDAAAPTAVGLSATTIASQSAASASTIATLSATDSQSITYSLAAGDGTNDADNGSFTISGNSLKVGASSLTAGTYKIYVAATDTAGNVANQAFTLTIVDAPGVSSIVRAGGASATVDTSATSVQYTVTLDQSVTGVDASDFALTATGTASGNIASVSGSGTTYTVTVDTLSGDGTMRLDLNGSGTGIQNGSSIDILGGYTSGAAYTLDHTAPNAPSTPDMTSGTDTGSSNSDNITSNTTPTFTGTAESGSTIKLYDTDGTTVLGTATAAGGNWSITSSTLSDGNHTVTAKAIDAAGNVSSASSGLTVTTDATAPTVASVSVPSNGSYKAGQTLGFTVNTDGAVTVDTSGGTPRIALTVGGSTVYADYASGSGSSALVFTYTVQAGDTDADGITVGALQSNGGTLKDAAGNGMTLALNSVGSTASVLVDTTAPTVTDGNLDISGATGTGGTFKIGDTVTATWNNTAAGDNNSDISGVTVDFSQFGGGSAVTASNSGGTWSATYTIVSGAIDGTSKNVSVTATDNAGNATATADTTNATVDNIAPTATDTNISISGATGTGGAFKIGDTVTATWNNTAGGDNNSDTISGVTVDFSAFGGGSAVAASNSSGTWTATYTIISGALDGATNRNVSVTATDNAGNANTTADTTNATVDNVAPAITFSSPAFSNDTGSSSADFITKTASQTITATLSGAPAGGDIVYGSLDNGTTWTDITSKVSGTALTWDGVTLTGSSTLKLKITDAAGNDGAIKSQAYTLDTTAPTTTVTSVAFSSDTGSSSTDFITQTAAQTVSGSLSANLASGETVYVSLDNGATWAAASSSVGQNTWSLASRTLTSSDTLKVKVTDTAGNDGSIASQAYTLDTTAPAAPAAPDMTSGTDSGGSSSDNITGNTGPTFTGTAESGSAVTLYDTDGTTVLGTATATGGNWSITSSTLSEGSHTLTAKATDAAGNVSSASSGLAVTIDTIAPTVASVAVPSAGTYKAGQTLGFTINTSEAVMVDTAGGTPRMALTVGSSTVYADYVSGSGSNALLFRYTVQAGDVDNDGIAITALQSNGGTLKDAAGNSINLTLGGVAATSGVRVDAVAPIVTDANIAISGATGTGGAFKIGDTVTATWNNTAGGDNNSDVSDVTVDFSTFGGGSAVAASNSSGTWTATYTIVSGALDGATNRNVSVTATDNAGNANTTADTTNATVDNVAPTIAFSNPAFSNDTGSSSADFITKTASQTITATLSGAPAGSDIVYGSLDDGTTWTDITSKVSGTALTWDGVTLTGSSTLKLKITDAAGNDGAAMSQAYALDTTAPAAPGVTALSTAALAPRLTGTATLDAGDSLTVTVAGATYHVTPAGSNWSLDLATATPASGTLAITAGKSYSVVAAITDLAGNTTSASGTLDVVAPPITQPTADATRSSTQSTTGASIEQPATSPSSAPMPNATTLTFLSPATESTLNYAATVSDTPSLTVPLSLGSLQTASHAPATPSFADVGHQASIGLTQGGSGIFRVMVISERQAAGEGLMLDKGMTDQTVPSSARAEIAIPVDAFAHTDPGAVIWLSAQQANGQPLPAWVRFDAGTGKFVLQPPKGVTGELSIKVIAHDAQGHEVATTFKIRVNGKGAKQSMLERSGRLSLSEQVRLAAGRHSAHDTPERLAKLSRASRWSNL